MSKRVLSLITFLIVAIFLQLATSYCEERTNQVSWRLSSMDAVIYDINPNKKQVEFQLYYTFDVNSTFEARIVY